MGARIEERPVEPVALHVAGPPRLVRAGTELRTGTRKALALAVLLALGGPAPRERLTALLWPQADPADARRNLRRDVFRLREAGLELADAGGDVLALRGVEAAFPAAEGAEVAWLDGLDALGGTELAEWLAPQRAALHARWLEALMREADEREARGDDAGAAALWRALLHEAVAGDDFEPARRALVRLHQRLGEHERALALATTRTAGARDGASAAVPHAGGRAAATASSSAPPARAAAAPASSSARIAPLPARLPFVGRATLVETIVAAAGAGRVVLIDGAPGAGKTRLALEAAAALGAAAGTGGVLLVPCHPDDAERPFASALRMLTQLREAAPGAELPAWVRHELAPLVPEWAAPGQPARAEHGLLHLRRAFEVAWRLLARDNFGTLVLDDWQWADASSLALWDLDRAPDETSPLSGLRPAQTTGPSEPFRPSDTGTAPIARLIVHRQAALPPAALERRRQLLDRGLAVAVAVEPLAADDLLALLRRLAGTEGGERFSARLHGATGGNPLFVLETLRHLFAAGLLEVDAAGRWHTPFDAVTTDYQELPVPAGVHEAVLERVRALGAPLRRVLEAASLAGAAFGARDLAAAAGLDERTAADALDHAAAAGLVEPIERDTAGRHRFTHDLLRQALDDSLPPARRAALHGQLADALAGTGTGTGAGAGAGTSAGGADPGRVAAHLQRAGRAHEAVRWHLAAAAAAERLGAWAEAERQYGEAVAHAGDDATRCVAERGRAQMRWRQGDAEGAEAGFQRALGHAQHAGGGAIADTLLKRVELWAETNRAEAAMVEVDALLADPQLSAAQRWRALEQRADCLAHLGRVGESLPVLRELLAALPATALTERRRVKDTLGRNCFWAGALEEGDALAQEGLAEARASGDDYGATMYLQRLGGQARERGDREASFVHSLEAMQLGRRSGNLHGLRGAAYNLVVLHTDAGDADAALPLIDEAEAVSPLWPNPHVRQMFAEARYYVQFLRGDAEAARAAAARVLAMTRAADNVHVRIGGLLLVQDLHFALDDAAAARALLAEMREVLAATDGAPARTDDVRLRALQCALADGDRAAAQALLAEAEPSFERVRVDEKLRLAACAARALAPDDAEAAWAWIERGRALSGGSVELQGLLALAALQVAGPAPAADVGGAADAVDAAGAAQAALAAQTDPAAQTGPAAQRAPTARAAAARAYAESLLADPHLPAFNATALRRALARA